MRGARAVQKALVESFPEAEFSGSIVWIDMIEGDSDLTAHQSARIIDDPRVRHFHDPGRRAGRAIARVLGGQGKVAWDTYLFFSKGSEWIEDPPMPTDWMHQLSADWADPTRLRVRHHLLEALHQTMQGLTGVRPAY